MPPGTALTRNQASRGKSVTVLCHHLLGREHPRLMNPNRILRNLTLDYKRACKSFTLSLSGPCGMLKDRVESKQRRMFLEGHRLVSRVGFQYHRRGCLRWVPALPDSPEVARRGGLRQMRARERALHSLYLFLLLLPPRSR